MNIFSENYYLFNLVFAVSLSSALLIYLNRFNADHPVAGAFQRMLLGVMGWAFFDFFIDHAGRLYTGETGFNLYRYFSFIFLFYQAAAAELIISIMRKIDRKQRFLLYSPFLLFYLAALLFPEYVSAENFGIKGGYEGVDAPWNLGFKFFISILIFSLLGKLLLSALKDSDMPAKKEKLILFCGGFITMSGVILSHMVLKKALPEMPLLGNLCTSGTTIAAFLGMKLYGRVLTERDLYLAVVKISPNGMVHLKKNIITWANSSTAEILGYSNPEDLYGISIEEIFSSEVYNEDDIGSFKGLIQSGSLVSKELVLKKKNGNNVYCLAGGILFNEKDPLAGSLLVIVDISQLKEVEREKELLIDDLKKAFAEIKNLSGMLPICSYCKKIRDDSGYWQQLEEYIESRSDAKFSHGMCNECLNKHHPDLSEKIRKNRPS